MKAFLRSLLRFILIIVLLPIALVACNVGYLAFRMYRLQHADHPLILAACREAITNRASYHHDPSRWDTLLQEEGVRLHRPLPDNLPAAIRELHPREVVIRSDYTMMLFSVPFARVGVIGFRNGAEQFGTAQYIDGLWFWNGNDSRKKKTTP